jgi:hypothetical protein
MFSSFVVTLLWAVPLFWLLNGRVAHGFSLAAPPVTQNNHKIASVRRAFLLVLCLLHPYRSE